MELALITAAASAMLTTAMRVSPVSRRRSIHQAAPSPAAARHSSHGNVAAYPEHAAATRAASGVPTGSGTKAGAAAGRSIARVDPSIHGAAVAPPSLREW